MLYWIQCPFILHFRLLSIHLSQTLSVRLLHSYGCYKIFPLGGSAGHQTSIVTLEKVI